MGRHGGGVFEEQSLDLTSVVKAHLNAMLRIDRKRPRREAGSSVGERCQVQTGADGG